MAKARSGSAVKKGLKFLVYGRQGTRKSSFALDFVKMKNELGRPLRVFYLDSEFGSIDNYLETIEEQGIDLANLFIVYTNTYNEAEEWLGKAMADEELYFEDEDGNMTMAVDADGNKFVADVIVLDSITPIMDTVKYGMIKTSEKRAKLRASRKENTTQTEIYVAEATAGMEFKDYDKFQQRGKNLLKSLITDTSKYVCVISREKDLKEQVKTDGSDTFSSVKIGVCPDAPKDTEHEFFTVIHMIEDQETGEIFGQVERKDRTLLFERGEMIDKPSPMLWQPVIDRNKDLKKGVTLSAKYDELVEKESADNYAKNTNTTQKDTSLASKDVDDMDKVDETDPISLNVEIKNIRSGLSPTKRQALSANFSKAGLPKQPKDDMDVETLVKMLEVAREMTK